MTRVAVSEARATLPMLLDRVLAGEEVTITRHGVPVAVLVGPDRLRGRLAPDVLDDAERIRALLTAARQRPLESRPSLDEARAELLVADVRAARAR